MESPYDKLLNLKTGLVCLDSPDKDVYINHKAISTFVLQPILF